MSEFYEPSQISRTEKRNYNDESRTDLFEMGKKRRISKKHLQFTSAK